MRRAGPLAVMIAALAPAAWLLAQAPADARFVRFWSAQSPVEAAAAAEAIVAARVSFDEALARLKRGRVYSSDAARGLVPLDHDVAGRPFPYTVEVPQSYDPARKYQVRVQLHGGVGRPEPRGPGPIGALAGAEQIYVMPTAWDGAPWWNGSQVDNLRAIVDRLKRTYNVDENRIVVSGVSDGGTGAYYVAMRDTTPYAAFLPLNGFLMILANPSVTREQLYPNNLRNKPFFVVNGGRDPLYPTSLVDPYVRHLQQGGVSLTYEPQPNGVHNTAWWPDVKETFERFVRDHPRDPHPARLTWEAEAPDRAHWLIIDRLRARGAEDPLPDVNERLSGTSPNFGVRAAGTRITAVLKGSNAERLGFLPDDLVRSINARILPEGVPLLDLLDTYDAGARLTFAVQRGPTSVELSGVFQPEPMPNVTTLFPRQRASGRVDLAREGNAVRATTRGVAAFTLLLSPDAFDFSQPVTVVADGRTVFDGRVQKDLATLMRWAARDNDRTMLYGAELHLSIR